MKHELIRLLRSIPETVEAFTFNSQTKIQNLEELYKFKEFIVAMINTGISELGFNSVDFSGEGAGSNRDTFLKIFREIEKCSHIRYLKFTNCTNVLALGEIPAKLTDITNLSFTQCQIGDNQIPQLVEMLSSFSNTEKRLQTLSLNYNNITDAGVQDLVQKIKEKEIVLNHINLYNNKIRDKKYGDPERIFFC